MTGRRPGSHVRLLGLLVIIAGAILLVGGVATYVVVATTLGDQQITVSDDAANFGAQHVDQPWEAYAQANVIAQHANESIGARCDASHVHGICLCAVSCSAIEVQCFQDHRSVPRRAATQIKVSSSAWRCNRQV